eukprot:TRINITY_DN20233_c0_g1_i1.p2 TRINITY_DN20233_c0_g1~~TRINITY_DN20233_c0_g1_i1.p2  ORF type:complete len:233 (+),score=40.21 TRINITY_DN20233_c0_g1_i1:166-864(+)
MEFLKQLPTRGIITSPTFNFETNTNKTYISLKPQKDEQNAKPPQHLHACDSTIILANALASQNILSDSSNPLGSKGQGQGQSSKGQVNEQKGKGQKRKKDESQIGNNNNGTSKNAKKNDTQNQVGRRRSKRNLNEQQKNYNEQDDCVGPSSSKRPRRGLQNRQQQVVEVQEEEEVVEGQDENEQEEPIIYTEAELETKNVRELQDILRTSGLPVRGRKIELVSRILQAQMAD